VTIFILLEYMCVRQKSQINKTEQNKTKFHINLVLVVIIFILLECVYVRQKSHINNKEQNKIEFH
jgi:hypothetical protein